MNRLVRFLWVCDSSIVNQNLFLLEMHVLMTTEAERCIRHIQQRSRTMSKSLDVLLAKVLTSTDNIQTPKLSAHTLSSIQRTGVVEVAGEKGKSAHKKKTDMRSTNLDKTFHGTGSVEFPLQLFSGGRSMENMICLDDRQFYNAINDGVVLDRIYDFGWDQYVLHGIEKGRRSYDPIDKYHKIPPFLKDYILLRDNILGLDDSKDEEEENAPKTNLRSVSYDKINLSSRSYDRADLSCRSIDLGGFGSTSFDEYAGDSSRKKDYLSSTATNDNTVVPLDPYEDFRWMDANVAYTSYGLAFKWLSPSPKTDMPRGSQRSRPSIRPLMPELVENGSDASRNLLDDDEKDDDEDSDAGHYNLEEIKEIEKRSENILIQRIWRCFLVVENYQRHYQSQKYSLQMLRYGVRNALQNLSLFITRLRYTSLLRRLFGLLVCKKFYLLSLLERFLVNIKGT